MWGLGVGREMANLIWIPPGLAVLQSSHTRTPISISTYHPPPLMQGIRTHILGA